MKIFREYLHTIIMILFQAVIGVLLLINPDSFTRAVITAFGIVMLIIGVTHIIKYFKRKNESLFPALRLTAGIISLIVGFIFTFCTSLIMGVFSLIAVIYGIILLVSGVFKMQDFFQAKKYEPYVPVVIFLSAAVSVILGIIIIINPFETALLVFRFAGISMLIGAAADIITLILIAKSAKKFRVIEITEAN